MDKKYTSKFGELEKIIDYGYIKKHPYNLLFEYIKEKYKDRIIKKKIERKLDYRKENIKKTIMNQQERIKMYGDISMQPKIMESYTNKIENYHSKLVRLDNLEKPEEKQELIEKIYFEITDELYDNDIYDKKSITNKYSKLKKMCYSALSGVKFKNENLITEEIIKGSLRKWENEEVVLKVIGILNDEELEALHLLGLFEQKRNELGIEYKRLMNQIENSDYIVNTYILKKIEADLEKYEGEALRILHFYKKLENFFVIDNIIEEKNGKKIINLTLERLEELELTRFDIKSDIFKLLNIVCRLKYAQQKIESKTKEKLYDENLEELIDIPTFAEIEPRNIEIELQKASDAYRTIKELEYYKLTEQLANIELNKNRVKTPLIKNLEEDSTTNLYTLYQPSPQGTISRKNALYILELFYEIEKNTEEFNELLENDKISYLSLKEENVIDRIIRERMDNYINDKNNYQKKLMKKRRKNEEK